MPLTPGTQLVAGRYEIVAMIGAGGMGEVYRARDAQLNRFVAIKTIPDAFAADPDRMRRFEQEAQAAAALNHPNILTVFDVGVRNGVPFVVSELLEGSTLAGLMAGGPLRIATALDYAAQIASGLAAAHDHGLVHRDIKPDNVFVTTRGRVKLLDFGLARALAPSSGPAEATVTHAAGTVAGTIVGTVRWMSPEQASGQPVDARADIFSFGVVLYEMLAGAPAFNGSTTTETIAAVLAREPRPLSVARPEVPVGVQAIVARCLAKPREERFQSAHDLAFALTALTVGPTGAEAASHRSARPLRWLSAGAFAIAFAAAGWLVGRSRGPATVPDYRPLTFRRGAISGARFAPDDRTILYSAAWQGGPIRLYATRTDSRASAPLGPPEARLLALSSSGQFAVRLGGGPFGTLAVGDLAGGAQRDVLEDVSAADWSPDGSQLAVIHRANGRQRLEYPIGRAVHEAEPSRSLYNPRVSPAGDSIALIEQDGEKYALLVFDLQGKIRRLSENWADIWGIAWTPRGDELWMSARRADALGGLTLRGVSLSGTERAVARLPGLPIIEDIRRDGRVLLRRDDWTSTLMCRAGRSAPERDVSGLDFSVGVAMSGDGRKVLISEEGLAEGGRHGIYLRDTAGDDQPVRLGDGNPFALSPDGKWVAAGSRTDPHDLMIVPTGAGQVRHLPNAELSYREARWFPDGRRLLVQADAADRKPGLYVVDVNNGRAVLVAPGLYASMEVSPDGETIAVAGLDGISLLPADGHGQSQAASIPPGLNVVGWSRDGRELFVASRVLPVAVGRYVVAQRRLAPDVEFAPVDRAGTYAVRRVVIDGSGDSYCYSYLRTLAGLYLVDGLK